MSVLFRVHTAPLIAGMLFAVCDPGGGGGGPAGNTLLAMSMLGDGSIQAQWDHGSNIPVVVGMGNFNVQPYQWTLATIRRSVVTSTTAQTDLVVNGAQLDTHTVTAPTDGGNAILRIGSFPDSEGSAEQVPNVDIAGVYVWGSPLPDQELEEDWRRVLRLPFYTRHDLSVTVYDAAGAPTELTNVDGVLDVVDKVEVTNEIDQPTITAAVTLTREHEWLSLATELTTTKPNLSDVFDPSSYVRALLLEGSRMECKAARMPLGIRARSSEMQSLFDGVIDDIDEGGDQIIMHARDGGGILVDAFCEEEVRYGTPGDFVEVEGEMQFILDDNDNDTTNNSIAGLQPRTGSYAPITLYVPVSPHWAITSFVQKKESVLAALRDLAAQLGWECRFLWIADPFAPGWRLTFYDPLRLRTVPDIVISPDDVLSVQRMSRSLFGVRNVVRVIYSSSEGTLPTLPALPTGISGEIGWWNLDGQGQRMVAFVQLTSDRSIAVMGRRQFMEVIEAGTSQIDTLVEASKMALSILLDLEVSNVDKEIETATLWELDINDMARFTPNPILFTGQQTLAIRQLTHTFDSRATTTMQLRGKPAVGFKRWLQLESRNGRPGVIDPGQALTDVRTGELLRFFRGLFDHSSLLQGGKFLQVRNGDFGSWMKGLAQVPDSWSMRAGVFGTDAMEVGNGAATLTGGHAVRFKTGAQLVSDPIPISGDPTLPYSLEVKWLREQVDTTTLSVTLEWLDVNGAFISSDTVVPGASTWPTFQAVPTDGNTWFQSRCDGLHPPDDGTTPKVNGNARFVRIVLGIVPATSSSTIVIDDVAMYRTAREVVTFTVSGFSPFFPSGGAAYWQGIRITPTSSMDTRRYDYRGNLYTWLGTGTAGNEVYDTQEVLAGPTTNLGTGFRAREDMTVNVVANVAVVTTDTDDQTISLRLVRNATYTANPGGSGDMNRSNNDGTVLVQVSAPVVQANKTGNPNFSSSADSVKVAFIPLTARVALARGDRLTFEYFSAGGRAIGSIDGSLCNFSFKQDIAQ